MKVLAIIACLLSAYYADAALRCSGAFDVVFVTEASSHLPDGQASYIQEFLSAIADQLTYASDALGSDVFSRVAYEQYDATGSTIFNLQDNNNKNDVESIIIRTPIPQGADDALIDQALDYTLSDILTVSNGERACRPVVVILVSYSSYFDANGINADANANARPYTPKNEQEQLALTSARNLIHSGALLITVGVGKDRNPPFLIGLTNGIPGTYFDFNDFSDLQDQNQINAIVDRFCNAPLGPWIPPQVFYPFEVEVALADIVFVVDVSQNAAQNIDDINTFFKNFLAPFTYGPNGVQAAVVPYSVTASPGVYLNDTNDLATFLKSASDAISAAQGGTQRNIASGLDFVFNQVQKPRKGYRGTSAAQQVYVITSDCFTGEDPVSYATSIRGNGAQIYVIRLDANTGFWKETVDIAGSPANVFQVFTPSASPKPNDISDVLTTFLPTQGWTVLSAAPNVLPPVLPPASTTGAPPQISTSTPETPPTTTTTETPTTTTAPPPPPSP